MMTRKSVLSALFGILWLYVGVASAYGTVLLHASPEQFEFPSTSSCDLILTGSSNAYSRRYAAACDVGEGFQLHGFVTALGDPGGWGGSGALVGGALRWVTSQSDTTHMGCFRITMSAVDAAANYDTMLLRTTVDLPGDNSTGWYAPAANAIRATRTSVASTLKRASDGVDCTATSCNSLPLVAKASRLAANSCCLGVDDPDDCCTGAGTGTCTDITGPLWVLDMLLDN